MSQDSTFFDVPRTRQRTSAGEVDLPILYYSASALWAFFRVELARAEAVLAGTGLRPIPMFGKKAFVGLAFFEYRETSIGPYNEVGLAIGVVPASETLPALPALSLLVPSSWRRVGFHIVDLPVTTAAANAAGRELWGYPKFVTKLPIDFGRATFFGQVLHPETGAPILTLQGPVAGGIEIPAIDLVLYSQRDGRLLRTQVKTRGRMRTSRAHELKLTVGPPGQAGQDRPSRDSPHPMTDNLRALGLDGAAPLFVQRCDRLETVLPAGEPVR